ALGRPRRPRNAPWGNAPWGNAPWRRGRRLDKLRQTTGEACVVAIIILVLLIVALVITFSAIKTVPQGFEFTVQRFGRYTRALKPGITILTPFVETVGRRVSMMEQVLPVPQQEVITKDNVGVQVDAIVFIQVMDAAAAAYRVANLN